jgi:glycosyltransferase involved in cell wall biosynthesis
LSPTAYKIKNAWIRFLFSSKRSFLFVTGDKGVKIASEIWKLNPERIANFPFVTDHSFFKPQATPEKKSENNIVFLSSGRIDFDHKGYDVAISAFKLIVEKGIENFRYCIAGVGPDLPKLERLISEACLEDHVILLGWVEFDELPAFYNSGHVLLHPSNEDPFPNAILEAMSCGLPVIGSNKAGSAVDRIEPGKNGYLFNAGNYIELAEIISKMIREKESLAVLGKNALETAKKWHPGFNVQQLKTVLKSLY